MQRYQLLGAAWVVALALASTGCGSGLVSLNGKVTLDGHPVEGATVVFRQESGDPHEANGLTDSEGVFRLGTFKPQDGVFPGNYRVTIVPPQNVPAAFFEPQPGITQAEGYALLAKGLKERQEQEAPFAADMAPEYSNFARTPLKQAVPADGPVVFEVKRDPSAKKVKTRPPRMQVTPGSGVGTVKQKR